MATGDNFTVDINNGEFWNVNKNCVILKYMFPFQYMWSTDINDFEYYNPPTNDRKDNIAISARVYGVFLQNRSGTPNTLIAKMEMPVTTSVRGQNTSAVGPGSWDDLASGHPVFYLRDEDNFFQYPILNSSRRIAFTATIPGTSRVPTCSLRLLLAEL